MEKQLGWTTIEQSKKLIEAGLDSNTADMFYQSTLPKSGKFLYNPTIGNPYEALKWYNLGYTKSGKTGLTFEEFCVPCWSLGALLELMPKAILNEYGKLCMLVILSHFNDGWKWSIFYTTEDEDNYSVHEEEGNTVLEAVCNMVAWLFENGYLKKK